MKTAVLNKDCRVNLKAGTSVNISDEEYWRLSVLGCVQVAEEKAVKVEKTEAPETPKATKKKTTR